MQEHTRVEATGIEARRWPVMLARLASGAVVALALGCSEPGERTAALEADSPTSTVTTATATAAASATTSTTTSTTMTGGDGEGLVVGDADTDDTIESGAQDRPDPAAEEAEPVTVTVDGDRSETTDVEGAGPEGADPSTGGPVTTRGATTVDPGAMTGDDLEDFLATRYEAFWQAFGQARMAPTASPTTDFPALADLAAGEQLEQATAEILDLASNGQALRAPQTPAVPGLDADSAHRVRVERVDGSTADLVACFVNDRIAYQVADGAVISDAVVTVKAEATMAMADGTWKLIRSRAVALEPGVAGCWLEGEADYPW